MALVAASFGLATGKASITCFFKPQSSAVRLKPNSNEVSELGFVTSQLSGLKISHHQCASPHKLSSPIKLPIQPVALWWEAGKRFVKLRLSTKALKTIEKNGLDAVAKKAGIDLSKK
ncbi:Ribosomal protein L28 [Cynara cardunculus var. scolymus]|uniref:Ribosomal protein L28 n=1 Tax=Cynara cardunculus var. scolymus TaxID=59895 RepID=A0A118K4V5_CYNCS|nr:Ribosomal protein L28 [Cynara cardunculus var. scolymus]